jgi:CheY-like chemotaxis protein
MQPPDFIIQRSIVNPQGESGIEMFRAWRPHFIWMDRRLPAMDGLKTTRCIRAMDGGSHVTMVGLSAPVFVSEREEMLAAGLDGFVRKPYLPREILGCMAKHLGVDYTYAENRSARDLPGWPKRAREL